MTEGDDFLDIYFKEHDDDVSFHLILRKVLNLEDQFVISKFVGVTGPLFYFEDPFILSVSYLDILIKVCMHPL